MKEDLTAVSTCLVVFDKRKHSSNSDMSEINWDRWTRMVRSQGIGLATPH